MGRSLKRRTQKSEYGIAALPCPFCGDTYKGLSICHVRTVERMECYGCGALGPLPDQKYYRSNALGELSEKDIQRASLEAWNRRTT